MRLGSFPAKNPLVLRDGHAEMVIAPWLGGGVASYDVFHAGRRLPLLRPCRRLAEAVPFDLGLNVLAPWSGRISGGGFTHTQFYALKPNLAGEPLPIHGNAFQSPWTVETADGMHAVLSLRSVGPGPFDYRCEIVYALVAGVLQIDVTVEHLGSGDLPYGVGLHPWFPRTTGTTLRAPARTVALEDGRHLPAGECPVSSRPEWDFSAPRRLPDGWINNGFAGWNGRADIKWPDQIGLRIESSPQLSTYILYSPGATADFFCFEPVSHGVDAHNQPGGPVRNGLVILRRGERLSASTRFLPQFA